MYYFEQLVRHVPVELFVAIGTFLEEVISPIPSVVVLLPAGAAAHAQGMPVWYLGVLAVISAASRIVGALILYWLADKFEDVIFKDGQRMFGVTHKDIEKFGQSLGSKRGKVHVWLILFAMHAIPIFPGALLSLGSGFIKMKLNLFVTTAFFGSIINAVFYLYLGYVGLQTARVLEGLGPATQITLVILLLCLAGGLVYAYTHRKKRKGS